MTTKILIEDVLKNYNYGLDFVLVGVSILRRV